MHKQAVSVLKNKILNNHKNIHVVYTLFNFKVLFSNIEIYRSICVYEGKHPIIYVRTLILFKIQIQNPLAEDCNWVLESQSRHT